MNRIRLIVTAAVVIGAMSVHAATDEVAKYWIEKAYRYRHAEDQDETMNMVLRADCADDTNRFLRLVKEVAHSNTNLTCVMIGQVIQYGSAADLPLLYEDVSDESLGDAALHGIFKIDGINTNTLMAVRQYLSLPEQGRGRCDEDVCGELLRYAMQPQTTEEARQMAKECIHDFALVDTNGVQWLDCIINYQLPDYRYSTNRLEVMRSVLAHGPKANQYDYVTNAIHEIEAHLPPE